MTTKVKKLIILNIPYALTFHMLSLAYLLQRSVKHGGFRKE